VSGVHAVVLAAGSARRFGGGKLIAPFRGRPLLLWALDAALAAAPNATVLVTGAEAAAVEAVARGAGRGLRIAHAADHAEGLSASLKTGLAALPPEAEGAMIFLGDMPGISAEIPLRLVQALAVGALAAAPVYEGRRGHPVAFARALFPALMSLRGDEGARRVLEGLGGRLAEIATENLGVLADVDTPADLARLERGRGEGACQDGAIPTPPG